MFPVLSLCRGNSYRARLLRWGAVMVMLCRGLLCGAVMFDMNAPAGSFGLVICSGFGPMFPATAKDPNDHLPPMPDDRAASHTDMAMDMSMPMPMSTVTSTDSDRSSTLIPGAMSDSMPMHGTTSVSNICAFSAALLTGIGALFVALLLMVALPTIRRVRNRFVRVVIRTPLPFSLPLSRAPPFPPHPA